MEEGTKKANKGMCECLGNTTGCLHHGMTRRLVLMILVVLIAFWFGMKLGEIKGYIIASQFNASLSQRESMMYNMRGMENRGVAPMKMNTQTAPAPVVTPTN
ncbi:hypothetical protein K2Q02_02480 [Patescibacteria group bacterium]|nr:hypothetical protein [Patescibacteria group bacterium]